MTRTTTTADLVEVDTETAAYAVGKSPSAFRMWAGRRGLLAHRLVRRGRRTVALWDLEQVQHHANTPGRTTP